MRRLTPLAFLLALSACGGSSPSPGPSPQPGGGTTIRGTERIGWDQPGAAAEVSILRYAIYVDGNRSEVSEVSCDARSGAAGYACSGRLPPLTPGAHTLQLAAFMMEGGNVIESPRSVVLQVTVNPSSTAATTESLRFGGAEGADPGPGERQPTPIASGYQDVTDLSAATPRLLLVAESHGILHLVDLDKARRDVSQTIEGTRAAGDAGTLSSVAADPNFAATGIVYLLQTAVAREGLVWQVVRYRVAGGTLGERAVLLRLSGADAQLPGTIRAGDDGRLYVALPGGYLDRSAGRGYVLRLNTDGSTPREEWDALAPLWATTASAPKGLAWHPAGGALWTSESSEDRNARLLAIPADRERARASETAQEFPLPGITGVRRIAASAAGNGSSPGGGILIAAESGLYLAQPPADTGTPLAIERLVETPARAVVAGLDGLILVATADAVAALGRR